MITVTFYGYSVKVDTLRVGQAVVAQAEREKTAGDIDKWYYAGCPIGRAYKKWKIETGVSHG